MKDLNEQLLDFKARQLAGEVQQGDLVVCLGAGDITKAGPLVCAELSKR